MASFRDLGLKEQLVSATEAVGFEAPSPIQVEAIPQAVNGTDVICQAQSGMGKTAVFVLSTLSLVEEPFNQTSGLVLVHTLELAHQVGKEYERFASNVNEAIKIGIAHGGNDIRTQTQEFKANPPTFVVGTPERVSHLIRNKALNLDNLKYFVVDEADALLADLQRRREVQEIFLKTPREKQVFLMSATLPEDVKQLAKKMTRNAIEHFVTAESNLNLAGLQQFFQVLKEDTKIQTLIDFIDGQEFNQMVIFVKNAQRAKALTEMLTKNQIPALCLTSNMPGNKRVATFEKFQANAAPVLVTTDLFARGVDILKCNVVLQFDMSEDPDTYFHRIGRAGRFGTKGLCVTFISNQHDVDVLKKVQERFAVPMKKWSGPVAASTYMTS